MELGPTIYALAAYSGWVLLLAIVVLNFRGIFLLTGKKKPHEFTVDSEDLGEFSKRLHRAYANCYENLPVFVGIVAAAALSGNTDITDPLAMIVVYARIAQSVIHMLVVNWWSVLIRATAWFIQLAILAYWVIQLLF